MPQSNDSKQLKVGDTFNPYRVFFGIFIPEALVSYHGISAETKLCYGVLCRFAGEDGYCFPGQEKLAKVMNVCDRQARRYVAELIADGWIRSARRGLGQTNTYEFVWHPAFVKRTKMSPRIGQQMSSEIGQPMSSEIGQPMSGPLKEEESQYNRTNLRESEYRVFSQDVSPLNPPNPKTENLDTRARNIPLDVDSPARNDVQRLDTTELLYLDDPIEQFIRDAGRREHRLSYKLTRRQDESLVEDLRHLDSPQFRAAFLEYLEASDEWLAQEGWPVRNFVKHWELYDRSLDDVQDSIALGQDTELDLTREASVVSEHPPVAAIVPGADLEVLSWRPHQFAEYWNALDGLPKVEWHDLHDRQAGLKAFADDEFRKNFKTACAIAVKLHAVRGTEVRWLSLRWLLKYPAEGVANWWKLISGEFAWMLETGGRPKTGDQVVTELRQLLEQEEKARNENHP